MTKAEDIGSYDVTPAWEKGGPDGPPDIAPFDNGCQCGLCLAARAGHL